LEKLGNVGLPMIARWHLTLARRATITRVPFADVFRRLKRQVSGYHPNASNIGSTFHDLRKLYNLMRANGVRFRGTVLEIGSGWFPIAPIVARLAGADRVILTDVIALMDQQTFLTSRQIVLDRLDEVASAFDFDPEAARGTLIGAGTPNELKLSYLAPFDITAVPDASLDLVMSRACLEHISVSDLKALAVGLRPKLKRDGFMAHAIDNSDHFSHVDPTLSRVNFLTWSGAKHHLMWQLAGGGENRLRHHEYADLFRQTGYDVIASDAFIDDKVLQGLSRLNLSAPYNQMTAEQIAAVTSWYVLRTSLPQSQT
jgi:hypothetical protein